MSEPECYKCHKHEPIMVEVTVCDCGGRVGDDGKWVSGCGSPIRAQMCLACIYERGAKESFTR